MRLTPGTRSFALPVPLAWLVVFVIASSSLLVATARADSAPATSTTTTQATTTAATTTSSPPTAGSGTSVTGPSAPTLTSGLTVTDSAPSFSKKTLPAVGGPPAPPTSHRWRHRRINCPAGVGNRALCEFVPLRPAHRKLTTSRQTSAGSPIPVAGPALSNFVLPQPALAALPARLASLTPLSQASLNFLIGIFPVPPFLLPIYQAAGIEYDIPWQILAAINEIETDYGRNLATSPAGAVGWMQFLPSTWARYGLDADGAGSANPYDPVDAIFAAARYLQAAGGEHNLQGAIFAYNHASWYVDSVRLRARLLTLLPATLVDGLTGLMEATFPVAGSLGRDAHRTPQLATIQGRPGALISSPANAPVIAVADSRVVSLGVSPVLGRFVTLEDSYGDRFTYLGLGSLERVYPVLKPRVESALTSARPARPKFVPAPGAVLPAATASQGDPGSARTSPTAVVIRPMTKERLFADPSRPASYAAGGRLQLGSSVSRAESVNTYIASVDVIAGRARDYFSEPLRLARGRFTLARLTPGAIVALGTVIGRVGRSRTGSPRLAFQVQPAGSKGPVDPRPIIDGWELLGSLTAGRSSRVGAGQSAAYNAGNATLGQLLMAGKRSLGRAVLADPRVTISSCARRAISAGMVDRRALGVIEYLSYSGLAPGVSNLACPQATSGKRLGNPLEISTFGGIPVAGHQQDLGVVDLAIRRLLALQGALRPAEILSLRPYPSQPIAVASSSHASQVEIDFGPVASHHLDPLSGGLGTTGWMRFIARLVQLSGATGPSAPPALAGTAPSAPSETTSAAGTGSHRAPVKRRRRAAAAACTPSAAPGPSTYLAPFPLGPRQPITFDIPIQAFVTPSAGTPITQVQFCYAPAGTNSWTPFDTETSPVSGVEYDATLSASSLGLQNGPYDFRAVATDSSGAASSSAIQTYVIAVNASYVALSHAGSPVSGRVPLTATWDQNAGAQPLVTIEVCPASPICAANLNTGNGWKTVATIQPTLDQNGNPAPYTTSLDTTTLTDGSYDVAVTAADPPSNQQGDVFQGGFLENVLIDNTPPVTRLDNPGSALSGVVTLTASAQDATSGVDAVKFQSSPSGANSWTTIGVATSPPYTASFDTRQLADGSYDLRVQATDAAGNTGSSTLVSGVAISNPGSQRFDNLTITSYVAPANHLKLLGEIAGSADHETWALGQTDAPPPVVDGVPLPYTAQGKGQLVLLRYTNGTGWEVADVLRGHDGSTPFELNAGGTVQAFGQMTGSGEAWLALINGPANGQPQKLAVFHRLPGGPFALDPAATTTLAPLLQTGAPTIRLGQLPGGATYGLLTSVGNTTLPEGSIGQVPSPTGPVNVSTRLGFAELSQGSWTVVPNPAALPASYSAPGSGANLTLESADPTGPGTGWAALSQSGGGASPSMILASFDHSGWHFVTHTGLDALDMTGPFAPGSQQSAADADTPSVDPPFAVRADSGGVWISATLGVGSGGGSGQLIARYELASGRIVDSWCSGLPRTSIDCAHQLDVNDPVAVPDAVFDTQQGVVAEALSTSSQSLDVYAHGAWTSVPTPAYENGSGAPGAATFADPTDGWLAGFDTFALVSTSAPASSLASWPEANRNPLLSVALPPGQSTTDSAGSLAVGLNGTALHYDPAAGWLVDATPSRAHHIGLYGVAFNGPTSAFAVGTAGIILRWNGSSWSEDPQSVAATTSTLNAIACAKDGECWAVGASGTILHHDGTMWSAEQLDPADAGKAVTSVAVAGNDVFAIVGGNLIERGPGGVWQRVDPSLLPSPAPADGSLRLLSGLPDGGLVVAGINVLIERQTGSAPFAYAPQSFQGIPVGLAAFRDSSGQLKTFASVAPPVATLDGLTHDVGGFPSGDGDLLVQTDGGWNDLSHSQYPSATPDALGDGVTHPDPVLAVASSPDGAHTWAVGGFSGTHAADGVGTDAILSARPPGWLSSAIWRYDAGGSAQATTQTSAPVSLPATPGTVSFAFFSSALCKQQCAGVQNAQPDVNLRSAAAEISSFAQQPGGPAFAILGGNARGPMDLGMYTRGAGALDLAHLSALLAPLGSVPTYAAYGPLDAVPTSSDPAAPWANVFAGAPAPFASGAAPAGITPQGSGDPTGSVNKYYAFDASQNGGTLRVIVLDNSAGSLEASAHGQTAWLSGQLSAAQAAGLPIVVIAARPLNSSELGAASDGDAVAAQLAAAGVLGVFTTAGGAAGGWSTQTDQVTQIPDNPNPANVIPQIPEYEGATLTYQQPQNNGVLWYHVSVDTRASRLTVQAIPVISSLALEPLNGLTAHRSSTLSFQAVARRPAATIATTPDDPTFPGYSQYVSIPSNNCTGCIGPSYKFASSNPVVGNFVAASAPGSPYPKLTPDGKTTPSSTSGLFCAFNSGTTVVSVTTGLLTSSLPVTVEAGGFGPPCGTVPGGTSAVVITAPGRVVTRQGSNPGAGAPVAPPASRVLALTPKLSVPPPPATPTHARPAKLPTMRPAPAVAVTAPVPSSVPTLATPPIVPLLIPPAVTPVPPGGASVSAQATARREEKARRHASQTAFVTRPAGTSATEWFYPALGVMTVLALLLIAGAVRPGPRPRLVLLELGEPVLDGRRRR